MTPDSPIHVPTGIPGLGARYWIGSGRLELFQADPDGEMVKGGDIVDISGKDTAEMAELLRRVDELRRQRDRGLLGTDEESTRD